jgi:hypothetical protein
MHADMCPSPSLMRRKSTDKTTCTYSVARPALPYLGISSCAKVHRAAECDWAGIEDGNRS